MSSFHEKSRRTDLGITAVETRHVLVDAGAAALDARCLQTSAYSGDCAAWSVCNGASKKHSVTKTFLSLSKNQSEDLLVARASGCHLFHNDMFLFHFAHKMFVNTWVLRNIRLWCMDWCHESVMCVDVQCGKTCCFVTMLQREAFFIKRAQNEDVHDGFGLPSLRSPHDDS